MHDSDSRLCKTSVGQIAPVRATGDLTDFIIDDFIHGGYGSTYGVTPQERSDLVSAFRRNVSKIKAATSAVAHAVLAREILEIPADVEGSIIECGVWNGASTASLSLVCQRVGRRLWVCDSFEGLPDDETRLHMGLHFGNYGYYKKGMFCGPLEQVQRNLYHYGSLESCDFIQGFFSESLKALGGPIVFAFLDVDLVGSTHDCLRAIWPLLIEDGRIYSDDAGDLDVVRVFFDDPWWETHLGCRSPGFVGSGCGLPFNAKQSPLGYARKVTKFDPEKFHRSAHLWYPDTDRRE